jgi:hypothetical protein
MSDCNISLQFPFLGMSSFILQIKVNYTRSAIDLSKYYIFMFLYVLNNKVVSTIYAPYSQQYITNCLNVKRAYLPEKVL